MDWTPTGVHVAPKLGLFPPSHPYRRSSHSDQSHSLPSRTRVLPLTHLQHLLKLFRRMASRSPQAHRPSRPPRGCAHAPSLTRVAQSQALPQKQSKRDTFQEGKANAHQGLSGVALSPLSCVPETSAEAAFVQSLTHHQTSAPAPPLGLAKPARPEGAGGQGQ